MINNPNPLDRLPNGTQFRQYLTELMRQVRDKLTPVVALDQYTVSTLPSASDNPGGLAICTDEVGGYVPCFSDGTNWRRTTDRAIVS